MLISLEAPAVCALVDIHRVVSSACSIMTELEKRIDEIEKKAAESDLIGTLATNPEVRTYNKRLTAELRDFARKLRSGILIQAENHHSVPALEPGTVTPEARSNGRDEEERQSGA